LPTVLSFIVAAIALVAGALVILPVGQRKPARWFAAHAVSYGILVTLFLGLDRSQRNNEDSPRTFAQILGQRVAQSHGAMLRNGLSESLLFYLPDEVRLDDCAADHLFAAVREDDRQRDAQLDIPERIRVGGAVLRVVDAHEIPLAGPASVTDWELVELAWVPADDPPPPPPAAQP
jgi:hypothetical protein